MTTFPLKTYQVVVRVRAHCPEDVIERLEDDDTALIDSFDEDSIAEVKED